MIKREQAEYIVDSLPCLFGGRESRVNFVEAQLDAATDDALIAAEADAARMREIVHALEVENHTLRQELSQTTTHADEADRLRNVCHMLEQENRICREDVKGILDRELADAYSRMATLRNAASAVLPLLRDRFDGTAEEPLVDALEHALGHTFDGKE